LFSGLSPEKQKIIKPLRSLRLCGEQIDLAENSDTYLTAQLEKLRLADTSFLALCSCFLGACRIFSGN
jgi:hypothetical protein